MQLDLIVENARIITGDFHRPTATRLGVWNGVFVGVDERIEGLDAAVRVDANALVVQGRFLQEKFGHPSTSPGLGAL